MASDTFSQRVEPNHADTQGCAWLVVVATGNVPKPIYTRAAGPARGHARLHLLHYVPLHT